MTLDVYEMDDITSDASVWQPFSKHFVTLAVVTVGRRAHVVRSK